MDTIAILLTIAWLLPLLGFAIEIFAGYWQPDRKSRAAALLAVGCIGAGFVLSVAAFVTWGNDTDWGAFTHAAADDHAGHGDEKGAHGEDGAHGAHGATGVPGGEEKADVAARDHKQAYSGVYYRLAKFGPLDLKLEYYIDSLTILMFMMVTLIATCIHIFAMGYMSDELTDEYVDHHAHTSDGKHVHRPGRFYRFFSYLSLFCFSMLGLVIAGNIFQVFVFWELVGICSYLLIGFYVERKTANVAANKAFIMNRVGDFGFLIGLMILWTYFGTFSFGDTHDAGDHATQAGLFSMMPWNETVDDHGHGQVTLDVEKTEDGSSVVPLQRAHAEDSETGEAAAVAGQKTIPYWLLVLAGLGIFAGCIGKSAQFPLQTWLPDAMEGPTPVSALVHSATMVAAGVYLAGRFFPMFTPEVLLCIAYIGCITLFVAATIAIVVTDIKQVLAYSTISQLGYMMLAIGVAGWAAGLFHLITHAFFKSLMFLASGSVIHGCHHEQQMTKMGGLRKKMPITAFAMLVGVIAIAGLAIPGIYLPWVGAISLSGYHSKDAIVATSLAYTKINPQHFLLFLMPLVTAGITACYMFRLWFMTFAGQPRDQHVYDHCHESPKVMTVPLIILSVFAAFCALGGEGGPLYGMIAGSEPSHVAAGAASAGLFGTIGLPGHHAIHEVHSTAGMYALIAAFTGFGFAWAVYCGRMINPAEIKNHLAGFHSFLVEKWQFDRLYDAMFVRPCRHASHAFAWFDRVVIDGFLHGITRVFLAIGRWDRWFDEKAVDGLVNGVGTTTFAIGRSFRKLQTGKLRQYVMFIALGVLSLFLLIFMLFPVT